MRPIREFPEQDAKVADGVCPHPECRRKVPFGRLGCPGHWSQLPLTLRRLILGAWKAGLYAEHRHWKNEAFRFWTTGLWNDPHQVAN